MPRACCTTEGCDRPQVGRGLCRTHYGRWYRNEREVPCSIDSCGSCAVSRGLCSAHYTKLLRYGDPHHDERAPTDALTRLLMQVEITEAGCWEYRGSQKPGHVSIQVSQGGRKRTVYGHRLIFERTVGAIPDGYEVHHRCHNPPCVCPDHLELLTKADHSRHHAATGLRSHCKVCGCGEWYHRKDGGRECARCRRRRQRRRVSA